MIRYKLMALGLAAGLLCSFPTAAHGNTEPASAAAWQTMWSTLPYQGDGNWSVRLPDGRSVWVTGDAIPRDGGTWASNTVTVVNGSSTWLTPNVVPDSVGVKTWFGPTAIVNGNLITLGSRVKHTPGIGFGFTPVGTSLVSMSFPSGSWSPVVNKVTNTPWTSTGISWTAGIVVYNNEVYIFGTKSVQGQWGFNVHVAKVSPENIHDVTKWAIYPYPVIVAGLGSGTDSAFSVRVDAAGWHLYTRRGGRVGAQHGEFVAPRHNATYTWIPKGTEPGYLAGSHPEVVLASGKMLVTLNTETGPKFVEVTK